MSYGELQRRHQGSMLPFGSNRALSKAMREVRQETVVTRMQVRGVARVSEQIMDDFIALDEHRRELAGNDPFLNAVLGQIQMGHVRKTTSVRDHMYEGW